MYVMKVCASVHIWRSEYLDSRLCRSQAWTGPKARVLKLG